jgi:CubicO group peptidase (beta-lactamase class C family)
VRPTALLFDEGLTEKGFAPRGDAFALGLDGKALDLLLEEAERTKSDSLLVLRDGKVVVERYFGRPRGPIETMSVTKSITALAVLMLVEQKKLDSLDVLVSRFVPELRKGRGSSMTVRHLLTQTSGLAHGKDARRLNAQKDRTAYVRRAAVTEEPGATFAYNNEATQLLSVVVREAAGKPVDAFLDEALFRPLGIRGWQWDRDGGDNVQTYYGLALGARDLARIGQLLLDRGKAGERQLLAPESVAALHAPSERSPYYGLLWWIRHDRVVHELDPAALGKLAEPLRATLVPLVGRSFAASEALWLELGARLSEAERETLAAAVAEGARPTRERPDRPVGFYADGSLGQRLAVFPEKKLVVVRQRRRRLPAEEGQGLAFPAMLKLAGALVPG